MKLCCLLLSIALSCCAADPPRIYLNSSVLSNQTELVLTAGSAFNLSCHGVGPTQWWSTAFRIIHKSPVPNPLFVRRSDPRHTGTYHCGFTNQSMEHLSTWIHLYVKDPADPSSVFVTPRSLPDLREGQDFLFRCLLTDPTITNLTLQSESRDGRGRSLPPGMNVTFDPRKGALIRKLQISFNGKYVCAGLKDGRWVTSKEVYLRLVPSPKVTLSQLISVRLIGEAFEVTCLSSSHSHLYSLTWTHPHIKRLDVTLSQYYRDSVLFKTSTVKVPAVNHTHRGAYTCVAVNEAGDTMATTHLRVLDRPYLTLNLQLAQQASANTGDRLGLPANITGTSPELQVDLQANSSRGLPEPRGQLMANVSTHQKLVTAANSAKVSRRVEVYEDGDVTLTFVTEAYPPIREQHWTMPTHVNANNTKTLIRRNYTANGYRSEWSLVLRRVRQEDRGLYSFHFSNDFFNGSQDVDLRVYRPPSVTVRVENDSLICSSSGFPLPTILWYTCPGVHDTCGDFTTNQVPPSEVMSQEEEEQVTARLTHALSPDDVTIECVSSNQLGESRQAVSAQAPPPLFTHALIGALGSVAVLLLLSLVLFIKWRQKPRYEIRWKIIESTDGNTYTFVDPTQLPYNQKWEFPRDKLRLGPVLGSGAFGKVVEATAYGLGTDEVTRVAVKMLKPSAHSEERDALMSELKILSHLGYHDNIVNLLGACTRGGPMLMITEYCSHGDLLNFLRSHSQDFVASILTVDEVVGGAFYKNMEARFRSDSGISCCSEYQDMQPALSPGQTPLSVQVDSLSVGDLMRFSFQVAQGLDFLSTRNCIHRDVAARNVLLTDGGVAKICDFGLARDIRNDDSYIVQGNARLPVKWMAPESIFQCLYTVQSDVWSYGVLLWEIFSLGKSPYPNVVVDTNFYKMIKDGRHMDQPDYAPAEMYELMTRCWSLEPTDRPTFKMIGQIIDRLHPSMCHCDQMYKNMSANGEEAELGEEDAKKRDEEEERPDRHDNDENAEWAESVRRNIYQLS